MVVLESVLTCPSCGVKAMESMPEDACQYFYECTGCGARVKPRAGDCCVFCSYGTVVCPPMQTKEADPMPTFAAVDDVEPEPSACCCCGAVDAPERMVRLGKHPEVALCLGCARWAAKEARAIEDQSRSGPVVLARDQFRAIRRGVVDRGWHRNRIFGRLLRWIGKRLP